MRIHATLSGSLANGPGRSFVVWFQGCSRHCEGCCNPETWDPAGGTEILLLDLVDRILATPDIDTVVLSGGEPLEQEGWVELLVAAVTDQRPDLRWVLFTGYSAAALHLLMGPVMGLFDLIVAGPYDKTCPRTEGDPPLLSSKNQELRFPTGRITREDLEDIPEVEFLLDENDDLVRTGIGVPGL